jgi:hypothetical protein
VVERRCSRIDFAPGGKLTSGEFSGSCTAGRFRQRAEWGAADAQLEVDKLANWN